MSVVRVTVERPVIEVATNAIPISPFGSYQPLDAGLTSLLTVDTAADLLPYTTAANTWAATALTAFARTLLDDSTRAAVLATLGARITAATPVSTTDDTNGTTWCTIPVVSGKSYLVMGAVGATTALASTACNLRFAASGGTTMSAGSITWAAGQSTTFAGGSTVLDAWTPLVSGLGTTERAISILGSWTCTGSGDVLFQVRTEVSGSSAAILGGAILVWEVA